MGLFGIDANRTSQSVDNFQVATQYGDAYGAVKGRGAVGARAQGNVTGAIKTVGKGAATNINISTADPDVAKAAIAGNESVSLAALKYNQELSNLAVGYANANATNALLTLQSLGRNEQVITAGGTAADVLESASMDAPPKPSFFANLSTTEKVVGGIVIAAVIGFVVYRYRII